MAMAIDVSRFFRDFSPPLGPSRFSRWRGRACSSFWRRRHWLWGRVLRSLLLYFLLSRWNTSRLGDSFLPGDNFLIHRNGVSVVMMGWWHIMQPSKWLFDRSGTLGKHRFIKD